MSDDTKPPRHWAWNRPLTEFWPLGDDKLKLLIGFVLRINTWKDNDKSISANTIANRAIEDRRFASQMYTAFKSEVDAFRETFENDIKAAEAKAKKPPKKKKLSKAKKTTASDSPPLNNVVSFCDFKKNKAG